MPKQDPFVREFFNNHRREMKARQVARSFISQLKAKRGRFHPDELGELLSEQKEFFDKEKKRVDSKLKALALKKGEHPYYLDYQCLLEHKGFVEGHLDFLRRIASSKSPADAAASISPPEWYRKDRYDFLRAKVKTIFDVANEPSLDGNVYAEQEIESADKPPLLVINDLPIRPGKLKEKLSKATGNEILVRPFAELAKPLIDHIRQSKPDMILLPMRGAFAFYGLIPHSLHGRIHTFDISEHGSERVRLEAISRLIKELDEKKPKSIAWLDDELFLGVQSSYTADIIGSILPNASFHRLALSTYQVPPQDRVTVSFAPKDKAHFPMLASKWVRLLAKKAREKGDEKTASELLSLFEESEKEHGISGAP